MPSIIRMEISDKVLAMARARAPDKPYHSSRAGVRTGGASMVRGFVAELMVLTYLRRWFVVEHIDSYDADIALIHREERHLPQRSRRRDITIDVKAIVTRARRRAERDWAPVGQDDEVSLHTNYRQRCDFLIFVRVHEDLETVWICGSKIKCLFMKFSRFHHAGKPREYRSDTTYHEDTRVMRVGELEESCLPRVYDDYLL